MLDLNAELKQLDAEWEIIEEKKLRRTFSFKGFLKTMSFVNAVAWQANRLMHHPDMEVSFNKCTINITTHDEGNTLTAKDFQLAKVLDELI
ncbi:MAG: 4a-hydroxytetrahydrobiopterin dehydratase [Bacteriovoracaceae bacterium]|jgi:4a-hydroxytetrahydrobiopterin dehydratase|nr:4a-hydroxytetrahydrobiopterin dehydratase [Halobacteriovoraceae bacterium]MDP7319386.1 4a-hydroxytetrahydrobiopterin dehydratase [Bacteriovoracaceae bacterium]|tara:strand:+ start:648 stop:920 length:273 start_codon:yes stop_codon:yes gene_type:complete